MFVDYNFYTENFKGTSLTEEEFLRFGNLACMYISTNTLSRINDNGINLYPVEIQNNARMCACNLAEYLKQIEDVQSGIIGGGSSASGGIVSSKTAGAVSVSYDTKLSAQFFLDPINQEKQKQAILRLWLAPVCINGSMYNLLSKVLENRNTGVCPTCTVI